MNYFLLCTQIQKKKIYVHKRRHSQTVVFLLHALSDKNRTYIAQQRFFSVLLCLGLLYKKRTVILLKTHKKHGKMTN